MSSALDSVLQHPAIWRGNDCARVAVPGIPSGFPELDAALPGGGWPAAVLTEIYAERPGIGELQIFMPAAARITDAGRWIGLVAPPHVPYAPALAAHGIRLARLVWIGARSTAEQLWACEQALRFQDCGAVLAWIAHAPERAFKRLQLAAEAGRAAALLFRPPGATPVSSAALRLHLSRRDNRTAVRILKRRGSNLAAPIALDLPGSCFAPLAARRSPDRVRLAEKAP